METIKIPKFENETDEANWAYEHREELAANFMNQHSKKATNRNLRMVTVLPDALRTKELAIAPGGLEGRSLFAVLREKTEQG